VRDEIIEVLVKCKTKIGLSILKVVLFILCGLAIVATLIGLGGFVGFIVAVLLGGAGYLAGVYSQVEYEYVYCNKEIDIDVIYNQSKRKSVMNIDLTKMEAFVRVTGPKMADYEGRQFAMVKDFSTHDPANANNVFALIYDGNTKILIEPNNKLLDAIYYVAPHKVNRN